MMEIPTKFDVLMAAVQKLQSQLDDINDRLERIEKSVIEPVEQSHPSRLERWDEPFIEEPRRRRRRFSED